MSPVGALPFERLGGCPTRAQRQRPMRRDGPRRQVIEEVTGDQDEGRARSGDEMDLGLKDKIAMVGGASKGLGFAVARALAREGARVCIASRDAEAICRAAGAIHRETGVRVLSI